MQRKQYVHLNFNSPWARYPLFNITHNRMNGTPSLALLVSTNQYPHLLIAVNSHVGKRKFHHWKILSTKIASYSVKVEYLGFFYRDTRAVYVKYMRVPSTSHLYTPHNKAYILNIKIVLCPWNELKWNKNKIKF